ncbi:MAG: hypothetical protein AAB250_05945, partial [Bdellovibrionota bacterium]
MKRQPWIRMSPNVDQTLEIRLRLLIEMIERKLVSPFLWNFNERLILEDFDCLACRSKFDALEKIEFLLGCSLAFRLLL